MATNGWIGEQTVHSWGSYNSRLTTNVYINSIRRYSDHIDVSGVIYLFCKSSGARTVWYDWAITAWCGGGNLGQIKPRTYNNNILGKSWSKNFSIRINCSNSATSATFQVGFSDSNMGGKDKYWTLYFDRYATSPSGITSVAAYTQYSTISTSCSGISWGQGYSSRKLTCTASYTYNGKTENFTLGTWTDGATSKSVTKSDFNFPADLNVTVKWTASTNIGSTSSTAQIRVKQTFPAPNLNNTTFTAESTAPYCIRVNVSGVDFGDNYSARKLELYGTYELDGIIYDNKLGEISNQTSWTLEYDASQEAEPWTKIPDDSSILLRLVADNGNRTSDKTIIINCQPSYEAYVIESIPEEEKEKSETYTGKNIQIQNAPEGAPFNTLDLKGNTSQQTYSGKNLCGIPDQTFTHQGVTVTIKDGEVTMNGTSTGTGTKNISPIKTTTLNGSYTTSLIYVSGTAGSGNFNLRKASDNTVIQGTQTTLASRDSSASYTITSTDVIFGLYILSTGTVFTNYKFKIQIVAGSTADYDFEPYTAGASPNPDYPQNVRVVTGENVVKINSKNLFDYTGYYHSNAGLTNTLNPDGTITTTGVPTGNYARIVPNLDITGLLEDGATYTLSKTYSANHVGVQVQAGKVGGGVDYYNGTFTVNKSTHTYYRITAQTTTMEGWGSEPRTITCGYQLEKGSSASSFEPYQEQSYEVNLGKNLFDKDNANIFNGYLGSSGIVEAANARAVYIPVVAGQTYTFSRANSTSQVNDPYYAFIANEPVGRGQYLEGRHAVGQHDLTFTGTAPAGSKYLIFYFAWNPSAETLATILSTYQLELGSTPTSYAAYFEPIELCKIGDYQDYIWKDGDTWKVHKATGKQTLSSTSFGGWQLTSSADGYIRGDTVNNVGFPTNDGFCDKLTLRTGAHGSYEYIWFQPTDTGKIYIQVLASRVSALTQAAFNTWLDSATPVVCYPLATPTDTEITNEALIEQLEAILQEAKMHNPQTNITTLYAEGNEQPTLDVSYFTDKNPDTRDELVIDSRLRTITLNGLDVYHLQAPGSEFLMLAPGENRLALQSDITGDNGYAQVSYKQGYLSI